MAIKNGNLTDADEVLNAIGSMFKDTANVIWDSAYNGWDSKLYANAGIPTLNNVAFDIFATDNQTVTGSARYDVTGDYYENIGVDDEINDSSYAHHWTADTNTTGSGTSTVVENTDNLTIIGSGGQNSSGTTNATSDGTTALDFYNTNKDVHIRTKVSLTSVCNLGTGSGNQGISKFGLTDGTNFVWLKTITQGSTGTTADSSVWDIYIDASADTCDLYDDGVLDTADIDISSLSVGINYYFIGHGYGNGNSTGGSSGSGTTIIYYVYSRKVDVPLTITTPSAEVSGSTITNAIAVTSSASPFAVTLSANNGSNYESVTDSTIHRFTNTGTQLFLRVTDAVASITVPETSVKYGEYAVKYNFY